MNTRSSNSTCIYEIEWTRKAQQKTNEKSVDQEELTAIEDEFIVVQPTILFVISLFSNFTGGITASTGCTADLSQREREEVKMHALTHRMEINFYHEKCRFTEHVECLFEKCVFEEKARGVSIGLTVVRIAGFIQGIAKHFSAEMHTTTDEDARNLSKLHIRETISTKG